MIFVSKCSQKSLQAAFLLGMLSQDKENTTESKEQSKRLKKVRPKVSAKLKNIDKKTHVESAARICNTGPSR